MAVARHVAIIMDGNGRWAQERGLPRMAGHAEGRKAMKRIVRASGEIGLEVLSVYAFSSENWARPQAEVDALMALFEQATREELPELQEQNVQARVSGRLHELPPGPRQSLLDMAEQTKHNTGLILNVACNYGGQAEIVDAAQKLARRCADGELKPEEIDRDLFARSLYQPDLPPVDLLIRPGGEMRVSNFLLWEIAYAEIYVTPILWPDFQREHLEAALAAFEKRERRFGKAPGQT